MPRDTRSKPDLTVIKLSIAHFVVILQNGPIRTLYISIQSGERSRLMKAFSYYNVFLVVKLSVY
jgi:hypothetical protein